MPFQSQKQFYSLTSILGFGDWTAVGIARRHRRPRSGNTTHVVVTNCTLFNRTTTSQRTAQSKT